MTETIESKQINDWLGQTARIPAGYPPGPLFRLSWADDLFELRTSIFSIFLGGVFVREEKTTKQVRKYPWISERWILEQWYPPQLSYTEEIPDSKNGSYECLYVFESSAGIALALNKQVVEFLVSRIMNKPKSSGMLIKSTITDNLEEKERLQIQFDEEYLDVSTDIQSNLHFGEGIIVPSNYPVESPNVRKFLVNKSNE